MAERCDNCEGMVRAACDARFTALAGIMINHVRETSISLSSNDLMALMSSEGELTESVNGFFDGQAADGCTLDPQQTTERLQEEIQRYPWTQASRH